MSNKGDSLGDRMKAYENISRNYLTRRLSVIIRVDGKAFHTFTRGMQKPFDDVLMRCMQSTMQYLCENIQGCVFGYTQSDEITLVLTDYATLTTDAWFGYNIQKMASVAASMATAAFNAAFRYHVQERQLEYPYDGRVDKALFDARVFTLPREEVCNCLIWRQQDATRNSIESVGQANFSHRELEGKSCNVIQDMLMTQKGINWNDFPVDCKRGSCCYRVEEEKWIPGGEEPVLRHRWDIDMRPPIFTKDREYIERWL